MLMPDFNYPEIDPSLSDKDREIILLKRELEYVHMQHRLAQKVIERRNKELMETKTAERD